ncbi:unnamed protein product [Darwinula stevensoni]|uniref:ABC-2 type transporter transmembrane domain-containing protein n=1 Tax=Darwinula stevensoni TaxID=69355 RepID=A0A7R9A9A9_9CRUS|nr:unnamed protein product [Darwinula stevensoni]CAG0897222.1 unnamed protein product [Darwinula stevensoni]
MHLIEEAMVDVEVGNSWGYVHVPANFSVALMDRFLYAAEASNETIDMSTIDVRLDMTNQQVAFIVSREILKAFHSFFKALVVDYGYSSELASIPVKFGPPIHGVQEPLFTEYVAPGIMVMIIFYMALGLTAMAFVLERKQGLLQRSYVAGVTNVEVMVAYLATQILVMTVQITFTLVFLLAVFHVPNRGSIELVILVAFLQGLCGMAFVTGSLGAEFPTNAPPNPIHHRGC